MENMQKGVSRIRRMYLSIHVHEEYDTVRAVTGTQNRLRICGKYLNLIGEQAKSI
jgi:hypothetical protein